MNQLVKESFVTNPEITFASRSIGDLSIPHQVAVNAVTGSADISVPLILTQGRGGFGPQLSLKYNSSAGNSVYGVGWSLGGLSAITINTNDGLPRYDGKDRFVFNGSDELVPALHEQGTLWEPGVAERNDFWVHYYRSKVERNFIQFEQWIHKETRRIHWRTRSSDNTVSIYGYHADDRTRIADSNNATHTYVWLIEAQYDGKGNAIFYEYVPENAENVNLQSLFERDRILRAPSFAQRYLKRIHYGNTKPISPDGPAQEDNTWLFEVVFDYGDHGEEAIPSTMSSRLWPARLDAHSTYRPGFEVRTYRICQRILMFHRFRELGVDPTLVSATTLEYQEKPEGSTLRTIRYIGFRRDQRNRATSQQSIPPLQFEYSSPKVGQSFNSIPEETQENLPIGVGSLGYKWIDLYGEGLPGILTETNQAWYYKPNNGSGVFGAQETVIEKPSLTPGTYAVSDFDQDGNFNLVVMQGRQAGFYEFDRDNNGWKNYRPFEVAPQLDLMGAKVQWLDLNGDGQADILISEQDRYIWYPSQGKKGFGEPVELFKSLDPNQPPQLSENPNLDFFFADMNGDGLLDLVRVQNGRIEYWPQIGNGQFGDGIVMENTPVLDFDREFDASRLRFTDLDGSGTADLLYLGRGEVRYWINASGNLFVEGGRLTGLPYLDNLANIQILDFLGDGTSCLVWSSALSVSARAPMQYLQLTSGIKPRLLLSINNSMGRETRLAYSLSTEHYLRDQRSGRGWLSKLPSHVTVVDRKEIIDHIGNSSFVSRYEYHDGYFDSQERVFRGFGLVDQYDSEVFGGADNLPEGYTAPTCSRTWFHNGAFGWDIRRFAQYYQGDSRQGLLPRDRVENLEELGAEEFEAGISALAGMVIRQEIYATDPRGPHTEHPYKVTQYAYRLRRLQPSRNDDDACFIAYQSEQLAYSYEQEPTDPRINHQLTLDVDSYGNVLIGCTVAYPRRSGIPEALSFQTRIYVTASQQTYLNIDQTERRELGIPIENKTFEIGNLHLSEDMLFQFEYLRDTLQLVLSSPLSFHESFSPSATSAEARLIGWNRNYYWDDNQRSVLPLRLVGEHTLLHHTESACFTDELISEALGDHVNRDLLETEGYYVFKENHWWQRSPISHYLPLDNFYLLSRLEMLDGGSTLYTYDTPYYLALIGIQDALSNRTRAEIDYYLIAPFRIADPNENLAEVHYDALGMVVVSTARGSILSTSGTVEQYGCGLLEEYRPQDDATFDAILAEPERFLQTAMQFFFYELDGRIASGTPARSVSLIREDLVHDGEGNRTQNSRIQVGIAYNDGFGRALQTKRRVESDSATERWLVSGHMVYNNKQQPVRQYEPFYSTSAAFETSEELRHFGVSSLSRYDSVGRLIRTHLPNGTLTRVEFTPWEVRNYDPNDTVQEDDSSYRILRELLLDDNPEKQALRKAQAHADTPEITQLDPLGREVVQIQRNNTGDDRVTQSHFDIQGNVTSIIDARGLTAFIYRYDMLGRGLYEHSIDSGEAWTLPNALDQPIHKWNGRGTHRQTSFDLLSRPTQVFVDDVLEPERVAERMIYGEDPSVTDAALKNARGQLVHYHDQAGIRSIHQYTPNGSPMRLERQLVQDYTIEPDWTVESDVALDPSLLFSTREIFDALERVKQQNLADGTTRWIDYSQSGEVAQVRVSTADGRLREFPFLKETEFNARGQRVRTLLGNDTEIRYEYDQETFRISRLTSRYISTGSRGRFYQDIFYTYDPVGNIVRHVDRAQQPESTSPLLFQGLNVSSHSDFTYDAFYQLLEATGRVHQALMPHDYRPSLPEPALKNTQHLTLNNGAAIERYSRTYRYDLAGNIQRINHRAASRNWVREMWVSGTSNHSLPARDHNELPVTNQESRFDPNGNCTYLPHLRAVDWNDRDNISGVVIIDRSRDAQPSDAEYYLYGADGKRVRKVHEKLVSPGQFEVTEKIYLDGCEIKRVRRNGEPVLERTTSLISDGTELIALLHQWTRDRRRNETDDISQMKIHYQLSNHLGSSSLEMNEAGNVISYEEYFPFGGSAFIVGNNRTDVSLKDYRYSGKERDDATGFYYYGYRYYVPWTGRWLSPDPLGSKDGLNLYQFVKNNPVNLVDQDGLQARILVPYNRLPVEAQGDPTRRVEVLAVRDPASVLRGTDTRYYDMGSNPEARARFQEYARQTLESDPDAFILVYDPAVEALREGEPGFSGTRPPPTGGATPIPFDPDASADDSAVSGTQVIDLSDIEQDVDDDPLAGIEGVPLREESRGGDSDSRRTGSPEVSENQPAQSTERPSVRSSPCGSGLAGRGTGSGSYGLGQGGGGTARHVGRGSGRTEQRGAGISGSGTGSRTIARRAGLGSHGSAGSERTSPNRSEGGRGPQSYAPPENISLSVNTEQGGTNGDRATGSPTGVSGSSGDGGLGVGDNRSGSRFGSQDGGIDGSLISGGEGGTEAPDLGDDITNAAGILNMDFLGYDPNDPHASESGVPGGVLGWLDFGETANQSLYVIGTILMMIFGAIGALSRKAQQAVGALAEGITGWLRRRMPRMFRFFERIRDLLTSPATRRILEADTRLGSSALVDTNLLAAASRTGREEQYAAAMAVVNERPLLITPAIRDEFLNVSENLEIRKQFLRNHDILVVGDETMSNLGESIDFQRRVNQIVSRGHSVADAEAAVAAYLLSSNSLHLRFLTLERRIPNIIKETIRYSEGWALHVRQVK